VLNLDLDDGNSPLGSKAGVGAAGADPLGQWAYTSEAFMQAGRLWGSVQVQTGTHWLRPRAHLYSEPTAAGQIGVEEQGAALHVGTPYTFEQNVHLTQLQVELESAIERARLIDGGGDPLSDFNTQWAVRPTAVLGLGLERNLRDLIPRRGLVLQAVSEFDLWSSRQGRRGALGAARWYLPVAAKWNTGVSLYARLLSQNRTAVVSSTALLPRSYRDRGLNAGTFAAVGAEVVQPLAHIDDGLTLVPLYIQALYAYGFGETVRVLSGRGGGGLSAIGGGIGVRFRFFYVLNIDFRVGVAYRPADRDVRLIVQ
jgi:hypothetical protein